MADIFISYAREDRPQAERLALALRREGFNIWWDLESLRSGQSFNRAIQQALEQAKCVVVLWTRASVVSKWVESEAYWAWEHNKLHSVRLDDAVRLPVPFNTIHAPSLAQWGGSKDFPEFQRLKADIAAIAVAPQPVADGSIRGGDSVSAVAKPDIALPAPNREPLSSFRDPLRDGGEGPEMVVIPAGSFWMGSPEDEPGHHSFEGPRHRVEIAQLFALGKTPLTFAEYDRFADVTGREKPNDFGWGRGNRPVIAVSWEDAVAYASWLCEQSGRRYRLPTDAEWEYACRAGTQTRWSFGNEGDDLDLYAWHRGNSGDQTHPVGEQEPNPWGLHEVHGNVWEWVQDCWHDNYQGAPFDGPAWEEEGGGDCRQHVLRGGSWALASENLRSAYRFRNFAAYRNFTIGFRLAQDL